jgi:hypothetical protein
MRPSTRASSRLLRGTAGDVPDRLQDPVLSLGEIRRRLSRTLAEILYGLAEVVEGFTQRALLGELAIHGLG